MRELVEEDQHSITRELTMELDISAMSIVALYITLIRLTSLIVGCLMTEADKNKRVQVCTNLFEYQHKDKILYRIITCGEK